VSIQVKPDRVLTAFQVIGSVSQDWLVVSAIVQAGAAVVIGAFTYALWRATDRLAEATKKYADLTEQMARLQSVSLAREGQATAPSLIAAGGSRNVGDDAAVSEIRVENIGGSSAYDVEIDTSWGTTKIQGPVREGIRAQGQVQLRRGEWEASPDKDPTIQRFRFKDSQGVSWTQSPGEAPVRVED